MFCGPFKVNHTNPRCSADAKWIPETSVQEQTSSCIPCLSVRLLELHPGWDSMTAIPCLLQAGMKTLRDGDCNPVQSSGETPPDTPADPLYQSSTACIPCFTLNKCLLHPSWHSPKPLPALQSPSPAPSAPAIPERTWAPPLGSTTATARPCYSKRTVAVCSLGSF